MKNLKELEKKYEELGKEIEKLKKEKQYKTKDSPIDLLSIEEYNKYKRYIPLLRSWWWLRSPGSNPFSVAAVNCIGDVYDRGDGIRSDNAVRPVLKIKPEFKYSDHLKYLDDKLLVYCGVTWIKIDKDLYISEMPIEFREFDSESTDYKTSEVRKYLLNWYKERKYW